MVAGVFTPYTLLERGLVLPVMAPEFSQTRLKLLYLGFAFPPGVQTLYPGFNPAGHALETRMIGELRAYFDIRSSGLLPFCPPSVPHAAPDSGIDHELLLLDRPPELFHRMRSLARLKAQYRAWCASGWKPDLVLVYNLSPIYNQFLLWLARQARHPKLLLLLLDSAQLGRPIPNLKRLRHCLKPMTTPDAAMLSHFDGCIGLSQSVEKYFRALKTPFLWMPGGCTASRALTEREFPTAVEPSIPIRFGYCGAFGAHAGVKLLIETFLAADIPGTLEICGYGKSGPEFASLARQEPRLKFRGLLSPQESLRFSRMCDVLVNPRPATHGNENNFASKLFDYALSGRAILTSRLSGVEEVLGPQAYYFDPADFSGDLRRSLLALAGTPRAELNRHGTAVQYRMLTEFGWPKQAAGIAQFLFEVWSRQAVAAEQLQALAA